MKMEEYEPWTTKPEDEEVVVEIKSATFGWNEVIKSQVHFMIQFSGCMCRIIFIHCCINETLYSFTVLLMRHLRGLMTN